MIKIVSTEIDKLGRAIKVKTLDEKTNNSGLIILSAEFCHYCIDDLAKEFADFMTTKGHKIIQNKLTVK